jgi:hypothetical protein
MKDRDFFEHCLESTLWNRHLCCSVIDGSGEMSESGKQHMPIVVRGTHVKLQMTANGAVLSLLLEYLQSCPNES